MPRHKFTSAQARIAGRKGGKACGAVRRLKAHSPDYLAGYSAGWNGCERFWRRYTGRTIAPARGFQRMGQ